ncbi:MAG TPA: uridine diphosphate-N-acetylglucosamine-binding protein YvcK [Acidimicrobiia bacterium]|nr:uridine diphosphate-N-acetylglucosamine-binding protein YvcK [Acidimicrobiia bacterium]
MTTTVPVAQLERMVYSTDGPKVVALGGGHGLALTLQAVQSYAAQISAIVAVADDGGSSGRLTSGLGIPPPGDVRRCLLALTPDQSLWSEVFAYRFEGGDIEDHSLGNLLLAALTEITGDFGEAVDAAGRMLKAVGRVIPAAKRPAVLTAIVQGREVVGQAAITKTRGIEELKVGPAALVASNSALEAIADADQVILGPGSLYTSLLAVLLVPGIAEAWRASRATKVFVLNLIGQEGETLGLSGHDHLEALARTAQLEGPGVVVVNSSALPMALASRAVGLSLGEAAERGWRIEFADLIRVVEGWPEHDPRSLGTVLASIARRD